MTDEHWRKIRALQANLPVGVPTEDAGDGRRWPITWGERRPDDSYAHVGETATSICLQCEFCCHYEEIDGDWGWCRLPGGQYLDTQVFEHWTCRGFSPAPDGDD